LLLGLSLFLGVWAAACGTARAEVKLDPLFTSGGVLQQGMRVPVFGTGTKGDPVLVTIQNQRATTTVGDDGLWRVQVGPLQAGGPYALNVTGEKLITIREMTVGEVWICAGGTNMQWTVVRSSGFGGVMSHDGNRYLSLFSAKREKGAMEPRFTNEGLWVKAGAASVGTFSAVGYFFGRSLQPHVNVPVGLISCNNFESTIESWISREALEKTPELASKLDKPINPFVLTSPTVLFNSMVSPILQYGVRGVIWYHGESEQDNAYVYRQALTTMIADWRKHAGRPDLPFILVQHAPYKVISKIFKESKLAELRESQLVVARQVPHTYLTVITDYGDQYDLHPALKEPVGQRIAITARGAVYGEQIEYLGPVFSTVKYSRSEATLTFDHIGGGLQANGKELTGFYICGSDHTFHEAKAEIKDNTVVVTSTQVSAPVAVRYGWADHPTGNLINKEGLPASPFRTDNFTLITQPK
jgi:sialate O-acetylesterase